MKPGPPHQWQVFGDLMVTFTKSGGISDDLWAAFNHDLKTKPVTKYLSTTVGDVDVTSVQRKSTAEIAKIKRLPIAVVTDSRIVRGMVTAVSWLGVDIKAFSWSELNGALTHLNIAPLVAERAIEVVERWRRESG